MKRNKAQSDSVVYQKPTTQQIEEEISRERQRFKYRQTMRSTICVILIIAALACLIANTWISIIRVYGNSMEPTIDGGDIIVSAKTSKLNRGDIIAMYCNNKLIIRRVIGVPGDWVDIDKDGTISVNGEKLDEYNTDKIDEVDYSIELPMQIQDSKYFVLGDNLLTSIDSRNEEVGLISMEDVLGKVFLRVYPFQKFGML